MDPISVAASIAGLITAASKVSEALFTFVRFIDNVPKAVHDVLEEVSDIRTSLSHLQRFLIGTDVNSRTHEKLLQIDQIRVALSNCVLIFTELEKTVEPLKTNNSSPAGLSIQWARREQGIKRLLARVKASRESLSLMLITMTCASMQEAQFAVDHLTSLVTKFLECNQEMRERLTNLESRSSTYRASKMSTPLRRRTLGLESTSTSADDESLTTVRPGKRTSLTQINDSSFDAFVRSFDTDLQSSRPYARAMKKQGARSTSSSVAHTMGWSYFSGLSLADVSEISVLNLLISASEIWNGEHYISMNDGANGNLSAITEDNVSRSPGPPLPKSYPVRISPNSLLKIQRLLRQRGTTAVERGVYRDTLTTDSIPRYPRQNIMLLGTSCSGKTTIYNHLQMLYGNKLSSIEYSTAKNAIFNDLFASFESIGLKLDVSLPLETLCQWFKDLWRNPVTRNTILWGSRVETNENVPFCMDCIDQLFSEEVEISDELCLRAQIQTIGFYNSSIKLNEVSYKIYDNGARNMAPDHLWGRSIVIHVVSLIDYCRPLTEYSKEASIPHTYMHGSSQYFSKVISDPKVKSLPMILLFNKIDVLEEKLRKISISEYFPDCPKEVDCLGACEYFAEYFRGLDKRENADLSIFVTSAVDLAIFKDTIQRMTPILSGDGRERSSLSKSGIIGLEVLNHQLNMKQTEFHITSEPRNEVEIPQSQRVQQENTFPTIGVMEEIDVTSERSSGSSSL